MKESSERPIIKHQHALMVLASFITTMAFQAGITPVGTCGGFFFEKKKNLTEDDGMWRSLKEGKFLKRKNVKRLRE